MIIHFVSKSNIRILEQLFSRLTPAGWVVPDWLVYMRDTALTDSELQAVRHQAYSR